MVDPVRPVPPYIAVVGPGTATAHEASLARHVGALLAQHDAVVVCGGLGGVMEACAEGASAAGGTVVGVLPGCDRTVGNRYLTQVLATGLGELRNGVLVNSCDALVAVGGSWGTLSEIALALHAGKPVASLHGWGLPSQSVASPEARLFVEVSTAAEAVQAVLPPVPQGDAG
ncbi:TIGR00725 family protein [Streptomyces hyaluromycini]|uniref:TIGR00725 family protein n=1 Tax=Streptomyces hyaluromycini TaxID=1377993 RepID=UPI000B5C66BF|nr:TIGR00725 family protein [Streptomyces hyaluromycini]